MGSEDAATRESWTVGRLLQWTTEFFQRKELDEPRLSAEILLAHVLGCERIRLYTSFNEEPDEARRVEFRELVKKAAEHTPIAYLVGHKEFYSLPFEVTPDVLIPRPETETLVEHAVSVLNGSAEGPDRRERPPVVLDVGSGSGCVVIAILSQVRGALGVGTDISADALEVARRNAQRNSVAERVEFVEADRLDLPRGVVPESGFDLIVCNPPYVDEADLGTLPPVVREYEPPVALSPGSDALAFYRVLAGEGPGILRDRGAVLVEIGVGQSEGVRSIFTEDGRFTHVATYRTPPDPHDRVMHFVKV
jgi:release factor glutamine methyltransferase